MGIFFAFWRRFFGGYDSKIDFLEQRGLQMIICVVAVFLWEFFAKSKVWYIALAVAVLVYIFWCCGHWYYFKCGTEDDKYIDDEMAKGRKIPFKKIVDWWGTIRGYEEFDREWCFWQLILCKTVCLIPVVAFLGTQYIFIGLCVAFVYNACYWVELKPYKKLLTSPTNWGEFWQGCLYFQGLF